MIEIDVICGGTGKVKEEYFRSAVAEYQKRLSTFVKLNFIECGESDRELLDAIPPRAYVYALCIGGKQLTSEEFSEHISKVTGGGYSKLAFIIGGSDGFGISVEERADFRLSFSKMTFPHRLMRVILSEQIYRAFTIIKGTKYHK